MVEGSLAVGEAVFKAASRRQLDQLLPFQGVLTLCLCLLTPPVGLQCVGSLAAPAVGAALPAVSEPVTAVSEPVTAVSAAVTDTVQ